MVMLCNSQPKIVGSENMACGKKRKISMVTNYDHHIIDVKELEKDNKILRTAMLKTRYADMIIKSQQVLGKAFDGEKMTKKAEVLQKQLLEEKPKLQRQRDREAARIAIASIKRTVDFDDGLQAERDLLAIIGATIAMAMLCNSQPKVVGSENMACGKKRKISMVTNYDSHIIDINELEKDNKILRAAMLKKRFADMIIKSQQQVLGKTFDGEKMKKKKKTELWEKQLQEEEAESQRERDREAARIAIASIKRTVVFDDGLQAERDLLAIIGATNSLYVFSKTRKPSR
ncbi:hypothetical protein K7X08_009492 [Anisodus acutangulus]|uniref:Uncharacterized protein n=1 Tax=Anisodus acutangulus TaxID=402998 RepID=A0A9Q1N109_9SOLA|nr:hypothetical protein K7X08_009492 [Anisodus acutangulus]